MREVMAQSDVAPNETLLAWKHQQMARRLLINEVRGLGPIDDSISCESDWSNLDRLMERIEAQLREYYREFYGEEA